MINYEELNSMHPIKSLLENLGLKKLRESTNYFIFSSPFREDKEPSMVFYKNSLQCIDFADSYQASLFKFIKDLTGQDLYEFMGIDKSKLSSKLFSFSLHEQKKFPERRKQVKIEGVLKNVETNMDAYTYCRKRNLFKDFREYFNIKMLDKGAINGTLFYNRLVIPIVEDDKIVSVEGRDYTQKQKLKVIYPKGGKMSTLFNIDNLNKKELLIVVEGIMDIPKIWKFFTKNITTTFGIMITGKQKELLQDFENIILFPDGDQAGKKMIEEFDIFYENDFKIAISSGYDPGDMSIKQIEKVLQNSKNSSDYFLEESGLFEENKKLNFFETI